MLARIACVTGVFLLVHVAAGQTIEAKVRMTNAAPPVFSQLPPLFCYQADNFNEVSIAVSRVDPKHLVAACNYQPWTGSVPCQVRRVYYAISTSGVVASPTFSAAGFLPAPPQYPVGVAGKWFDPMTAASVGSDDLWVGSIVNNGDSADNRFAVWRNAPGTGVLSSTPTHASHVGMHYVDKGLLATVPAFDIARPPGAENMYLTYVRKAVFPPCQYAGSILWDRWNLESPPMNVVLNENQRIDPPGLSPPFDPCVDRQASGVAPTVMSQGSNAGRLVVAYRLGLVEEYGNRIEWCHHPAPVSGSVAGWAMAETFDETATQEPIFGFHQDPSIPGNLVPQNYPSIATDPTDATVVYVAFAGSPDPDPISLEPNPPVNQNVDIYLARIEFVGPTPTFLVKRITDAMLGDDEGTDQFFPAVTVDMYGGINIAYVRIPVDSAQTPPVMSVSYARFASWITATPVVLPLSALAPVPHDPLNPASQRIGEYISIASSGCLVYASYPQCESTYNYATTNVYITRISVCPADTDDSGFVDSGDVGAFGAAFAAQAPAGDINQDGLCTGTDVVQFYAAYTCGCGTP